MILATEYEVQTDRGPMLIAATSQWHAEQLARSDGYKVYIKVKIQIVDGKSQIHYNGKLLSIQEASGALLFEMDCRTEREALVELSGNRAIIQKVI